MNAERFAALAALADARATRERRDLARGRAELEALRRRRAQLADHAGRYRSEPLGGGTIAPAALAHRHGYSAALVAQLEHVDAHVAERDAAFDALAARCRRALARGEALKIAEERAVEAERLDALARERRVDSENARRRGGGR